MGPADRNLQQGKRASRQTDPSTYDDIIGSLRDAPRGRPFVIGQLGQSLDGRIATVSGHSRDINNPCALDHLHRLRANVDAVLVGAGTILADDPQLNVRRTSGVSPARVVLDPSGRTQGRERWLAEDGARRIVISGFERPRPDGCDELIVLDRRDGRIAPADICAALFQRGLTRVLVEGGARTIAHFIEARALDRLHVLVAPVIIGSGKQGLELPPISDLKDALRPPVRVWPFPDGDVLFDCDLRS
jgi:diaminohydroxyphosphoribosylaminopyrimidine deaminase / 5-amino-6-(5-phosphoribosylamino)uracil reductase